VDIRFSLRPHRSYILLRCRRTKHIPSQSASAAMHCHLLVWAMGSFSRLYLSCTDTRPVLDKYNLEKNSIRRTRNMQNKTPWTVAKKQVANKISDKHEPSHASATRHFGRTKLANAKEHQQPNKQAKRNAHGENKLVQLEIIWLWKTSAKVDGPTRGNLRKQSFTLRQPPIAIWHHSP